MEAAVIEYNNTKAPQSDLFSPDHQAWLCDDCGDGRLLGLEVLDGLLQALAQSCRGPGPAGAGAGGG